MRSSPGLDVSFETPGGACDVGISDIDAPAGRLSHPAQGVMSWMR